MVEAIKAFPQCPTLSWMIASRVTNPYEEADAFILLSGRKGSGKSTASLSLCESIAENIAYIRGKGEDPKQFFNADHIKTVTKDGAISLLTSGILKKKNSVILLDDFSVQYSNRAFQTFINKAINDILMIGRVYSCVIIANCVMRTHIDKIGRELVDYQIQMVSKSTITKQAIFKCYYFEVGPDGSEYKKFLTWHGKRIKYWLCGKPSEEINTAYLKMRHDNTDVHVDEAYAKMLEKSNPQSKTDGRIKDYASMPAIVQNRDKIRDMYASGETVEAIVRATGMSRYMIQRAQAINEGKV